MQHDPLWPKSRIQAVMKQNLTEDKTGGTDRHARQSSLKAYLRQPIPLFIVYQTATVEESGEVRFFNDIYGLDATLATALVRR